MDRAERRISKVVMSGQDKAGHGLRLLAILLLFVGNALGQMTGQISVNVASGQSTDNSAADGAPLPLAWRQVRERFLAERELLSLALGGRGPGGLGRSRRHRVAPFETVIGNTW